MGDGAVRAWLCRIEVPDDQLASVLAVRQLLLRELTALGYRSITLDLHGFASGSFNALLKGAELRQGRP